MPDLTNYRYYLIDNLNVLDLLTREGTISIQSPMTPLQQCSVSFLTVPC